MEVNRTKLGLLSTLYENDLKKTQDAPTSIHYHIHNIANNITSGADYYLLNLNSEIYFKRLPDNAHNVMSPIEQPDV